MNSLLEGSFLLYSQRVSVEDLIRGLNAPFLLSYLDALWRLESQLNARRARPGQSIEEVKLDKGSLPASCQILRDTTLMVQKSGDHQLRLVGYPSIPLFTVQGELYIPGGCLGFLKHQQYHPKTEGKGPSEVPGVFPRLDSPSGKTHIWLGELLVQLMLLRSFKSGYRQSWLHWRNA